MELSAFKHGLSGYCMDYMSVYAHFSLRPCGICNVLRVERLVRHLDSDPCFSKPIEGGASRKACSDRSNQCIQLLSNALLSQVRRAAKQSVFRQSLGCSALVVLDRRVEGILLELNSRVLNRWMAEPFRQAWAGQVIKISLQRHLVRRCRSCRLQGVGL